MLRLIPIIFLLALSGLSQASTGRVIGVSDGDTVTVLTAEKKQIKVRLAGIDAPEKGQDYSNEAKQYLSQMVFGKTVAIDGTKVDRYGRLVAKVGIDQKDVNLEMIKAGLAWHFKKYANEQTVADRRLYADAEKEARAAKLGIWGYANPVAPWDFRGR